MKRFLKYCLQLTLLVVLVLSASLFFVPDVVSENSILAALPDKEKELAQLGPGKIVFVGGSNLSFGLDSKTISDSLHKPVMNMGLHAGIGLEYTARNIVRFAEKGDVIVLATEYENFYTDNFYGEMELVSVLFGVEPEGRRMVDVRQWKHLAPYIPTYSAKKLKNFIPSLWQRHKQLPVDIYHRLSFNRYGDAFIHWQMPDQDYMPCTRNSGKEKLNPEVSVFLQQFRQDLEARGARLLMLPPVIDREAFAAQRTMIDSVTYMLKKNDMAYIQEPVNYAFEKPYFFNSYYHLNKKGVDIRTQQVIRDLKPYVLNSKQ